MPTPPSISHGELTIALPAGKLQMHKPVIYQDMPDGRQQRNGGFRASAGGDITFTVSSYDPRRTLVIDPVLSFSTYLATQPSNFVEFIAKIAAVTITSRALRL